MKIECNCILWDENGKETKRPFHFTLTNQTPIMKSDGSNSMVSLPGNVFTIDISFDELVKKQKSIKNDKD